LRKLPLRNEGARAAAWLKFNAGLFASVGICGRGTRTQSGFGSTYAAVALGRDLAAQEIAKGRQQFLDGGFPVWRSGSRTSAGCLQAFQVDVYH
jgi:hypothetical protein